MVRSLGLELFKLPNCNGWKKFTPKSDLWPLSSLIPSPFTMPRKRARNPLKRTQVE